MMTSFAAQPFVKTLHIQHDTSRIAVSAAACEQAKGK